MKGVHLASALLLCACSTSVDVVPPCDHDRREFAAVQHGAQHLQAFVGRWRLRVVVGCVDLSAALTGVEPSVGRPLSQQDGAEVCAAAKAEIERRLDDGIELGAALHDVGDCFDHQAAGRACLDDCGASLVCTQACEATSVFQSGCRLPTLRVESNDPELRDAVQAHFAPILALDLFVAQDAGDGVDKLDQALTGHADHLADQPACAAERNSVSSWQSNSERAFDDLIDLLQWVRISRLKELP